ncbi:hypothetical protein JYT92_00590 [bacterium AH-315-L15]|nr:hypothetical protein [bacterium AH-315-L15]
MDKKKIKHIIIFILALGIMYIATSFKSPNRSIRSVRNNKIRQFVIEHPELEPMYKEMLSDGMLTKTEVEKLLNSVKK